MIVSPAGNGTVMIDQTAVSAYPATYTFSEGAQVNLEAVPAPGHRFDSWSGALSGSENPAAIVIDCNKNITANFSLVVHTLTLQLNGNGSITPGTGTYDYAEGTVISLTATPRSGWQFDGWTSDVADASSAETTVTIDFDKTVNARFIEKPNQISWPLLSSGIGGLLLLAIIVLAVRYRRQ